MIKAQIIWDLFLSNDQDNLTYFLLLFFGKDFRNNSTHFLLNPPNFITDLHWICICLLIVLKICSSQGAEHLVSALTTFVLHRHVKTICA